MQRGRPRPSGRCCGRPGWRVHGFQCPLCAFRGSGNAISQHQKQTGHSGRDNGLDVDRRRAVAERLVEAVVVTKAGHRGARWSPDRLEVVWRT